MCKADASNRKLIRGDGKAVVFCSECEMGVVEELPASTVQFYADGYYGSEVQHAHAGAQYDNYAFTAEHTLLWTRLMVEALQPNGGRILDVGCADGFLLRRLRGRFDRFGIEVNPAAALSATRDGITIVASDIADDRARTSGRFDVVTAIATLEHVLDIRGAVGICLDLLNAEGVFIFEVPLMSDTADNKDWINGSYEHIYYPTSRAINVLFGSFSGIYFRGFETEIRGFSSSYIGVAARDIQVFRNAARLLDSMAQVRLDKLDLIGRRLNLAYHLVHGFRSTPERVLALPDLLAVESSPGLLKRLTQLWHSDCVDARKVTSVE